MFCDCLSFSTDDMTGPLVTEKSLHQHFTAVFGHIAKDPVKDFH